jgi:AbrB family looped-hinge helix DNA binding protein
VDIVKLSAKFQVTIPKNIREQLELKPGVTLRVSIVDGGAIRLSPYRSLKTLRGIAKGVIWKDDNRDHSERL